MTRRGTTLIELLVVMGVAGILGIVLAQTMRLARRGYDAQSQRIDAQQSLRAAAVVFAAELRELSAADGDILAPGRDSIRIRAMRHLAFLCAGPAVDLAGATLTVADTPSYGLRAIDPGTDSVLIYQEGDAATRTDDSWLPGRVESVSPSVCPDHRRGPASTIRVRLPAGAQSPGAASTIYNGAPVRAFEIVTYRLYQAADGRHYLGQRRQGDLQPLAGPLTPHGLDLAYFSRSGQPTTVPGQIAAVEVRVRAATGGRGGRGGRHTATDSLIVRIALRGNPQW
jgi:type II secretory pathway pseudopilin PulG